MARSKVKGTNGKPLKKGTNRDKLRASVTYGKGKNDPPGIQTETKINDGDPHVYKAGSRGPHGPGPGRPNLIRRTTTRKVTDREVQRKLGKAQQRAREANWGAYAEDNEKRRKAAAAKKRKNKK